MADECVAKVGLDIERQVLQFRDLDFAFLVLVFPLKRIDLRTNQKGSQAGRGAVLPYRGQGSLGRLVGMGHWQTGNLVCRGGVVEMVD